MSVALNQSPSFTAKVRAQRLDVGDRLVAGEGDGAEAVARALFNGHEDVDALALVGTEGEPVQAAFVADLRLGLLDGGVVVALVAVGLAHALGVFLELGGVEGLRERDSRRMIE